MSEQLIAGALRVDVASGYDETVARVREALRQEGFGVITEIDVQATLREKLGVGFRRYVILGACNPAFAHRALSADPAVGLLLPCNVVVHEADEGGGSVAMMVDPITLMGSADEGALRSLALEVRVALARVAQRLAA